MNYTEYEKKILAMAEELRKHGKNPHGELLDALIEIQLNHMGD